MFRIVLLISLFFSLNFSVFASEVNSYIDHNFQSEDIKIEILDLSDCVDIADGSCKNLQIKVITGSIKGRIYSIRADYLDLSQKNTSFKIGSKFFATYDGLDSDGKVVISLGEVDRIPVLFLLLIIFIALVVIVSGKQGIMAILSLITNFLVLIFIIANGVFAGINSLLLVLFGGIVLLSLSIFLTYGINKKSMSAYLGSVAGLLLTLILTFVFLPLTKLTGFSSEEASFLSDIVTNVSMMDVLFVGICVGILGILDDVTINQSSLTFELVSANPHLSKKEVFFKALTVGKDHLSSMVNTLIIAYAGASFPLFLLLLKDTNSSFLSIMNMEIISEEIFRMLIGSIGLILTIPISTYIATIFAKSKKIKFIKH